jgi:hypothetical protein
MCPELKSSSSRISSFEDEAAAPEPLTARRRHAAHQRHGLCRPGLYRWCRTDIAFPVGGERVGLVPLVARHGAEGVDEGRLGERKGHGEEEGGE